MILNEIYDQLHELKLTNSHYHFSKHFLNRNKKYMSSIRARDIEPGIYALRNLVTKLTILRDGYETSTVVSVRKKSREIQKLIGKLHRHMNEKYFNGATI